MSFRFKQFGINQDRTAMKVGTDGVLLGAWVSLTGQERRVLDIGTGTGLIAIMVAQRSEEANIVGVEIDMDSAKQAAENMGSSPWAERLRVVHTPIQNFSSDEKFDLILSNPPYFIDSMLSKGESRIVARHTTELSFEELIVSVERLLGDDGRFAVILPTTESEIFDNISKGVLHLSKRCYVRGKSEGVIRRVMSEYCLSEIAEVELSEIAVRGIAPQEYTIEYRKLTADFYLK